MPEQNVHHFLKICVEGREAWEKFPSEERLRA